MKNTNYVFVLNADKSFLNMLHPARARKLLTQEKASVFRTYPFVIILKNRVLNPTLKPYALKIDPGSQWTGFAIQCGEEIVFRMELKHRGNVIKSDLLHRAGFRRGRRSRNLRYRKERFDRHKKAGWLPPSLNHRVLIVETWIKRFIKYCPIVVIEIEKVRFDTQKLVSPEISGEEYQQGTLFGYEIREYLLEKWGRECAYCGASDTQLEIEHIVPKSKGGSNKISNLAIACHCCNQAKGNMNVADFLSDKSKLDKILKQSKQPLRDAAAVNSTRLVIVDMAEKYGDVNTWSGGRTKMNRCQQGLEKTHSIDAACVGESGSQIKLLTDQPLIVTSMGHGSRQSRRTNDKGFPVIITKKCKKTGKDIVQKDTNGKVLTISPKHDYKHIQAGDFVRVEIKKIRSVKSKHYSAVDGVVTIEPGWYTCRVKTPSKNGFEGVIKNGRVGVSSMIGVKFVHRSDGYAYS